jgi:hypothetical protein
MRLSDHDYGRDLRGINLALRLLRHEARLSTVCAWTGFNEERVRILSRSRRRHQVNRVAGTHRGPSPRRVRPLFASLTLRSEGAAMAGLCRVLEVIPAKPISNARVRLPGVANGERLCDAFELFREIVPSARLTLEQAISLVYAVSEGQLCSLDHCTRCRALILVDHLSLTRRVCTHCQNEERRAGAEASLPVEEPPAGADGEPHYFQLSLFD